METHKFIGTTDIGFIGSYWPFGELEVSKDYLLVRDKLLRKEYKLSKEDVVSIKVSTLFSISKYALEIQHKNKNYKYSRVHFWYWIFSFDKLLNTLKQFGWVEDHN